MDLFAYAAAGALKGGLEEQIRRQQEEALLVKEMNLARFKQQVEDESFSNRLAKEQELADQEVIPVMGADGSLTQVLKGEHRKNPQGFQVSPDMAAAHATQKYYTLQDGKIVETPREQGGLPLQVLQEQGEISRADAEAARAQEQLSIEKQRFAYQKEKDAADAAEKYYVRRPDGSYIQADANTPGAVTGSAAKLTNEAARRTGKEGDMTDNQRSILGLKIRDSAMATVDLKYRDQLGNLKKEYTEDQYDEAVSKEVKKIRKDLGIDGQQPVEVLPSPGGGTKGAETTESPAAIMEKGQQQFNAALAQFRQMTTEQQEQFQKERPWMYERLKHHIQQQGQQQSTQPGSAQPQGDGAGQQQSKGVLQSSADIGEITAKLGAAGFKLVGNAASGVYKVIDKQNGAVKEYTREGLNKLWEALSSENYQYGAVQHGAAGKFR